MKRWIWMLLLLLVGCAKQQTPALMPAVSVNYDTAQALRGDVVQYGVYDAYVTARYEQLLAPVAGEVELFGLALGTRVEEGQLLAQLDTAAREQELAALQTQLTALQADYAAQLQLTYYDLELARLREENETGTQAQLAALDVQELEAKAAYLNGCCSAAEAQLQRRIAQAEQAVADSRVYAPCDGVVAALPVTEGQWLSQGAELLMLQCDGSAYVLCVDGGAELASTEAPVFGQIDGERYGLSLIEYTQAERLAALLNGSLPARFSLPEQVQAPVGTPVQLLVYEREARDVVYIPVGALYQQSGLGSGYVYRIVDGEMVRTEVQYRFCTESWAVIESGLEEGEVVYVPQSA